MKIRQWLYDIVNEDNTNTSLSRGFNFLIISLITLSVLAIILESFENIRIQYQLLFNYFEKITVAIFTVEYLLRLVTADFKYPGKTRLKSIVLFIFSTVAIIDLVAILPAFLPLFFSFDLRFIRILRILRITRLFKLKRYSRSLLLIGEVFKEKRSDLVMTLFITFILLVIASTLMFYIEGNEQPDVFPNIIATFWWAIATLTTVGYGDVYPITEWGKLISGIIALLGIGLVALPTGILSSAFVERMNQTSDNTNTQYCPRCGHNIKN